MLSMNYLTVVPDKNITMKSLTSKIPMDLLAVSWNLEHTVLVSKTAALTVSFSLRNSCFCFSTSIKRLIKWRPWQVRHQNSIKSCPIRSYRDWVNSSHKLYFNISHSPLKQSHILVPLRHKTLNSCTKFKICSSSPSPIVRIAHYLSHSRIAFLTQKVIHAFSPTQSHLPLMQLGGFGFQIVVGQFPGSRMKAD